MQEKHGCILALRMCSRLAGSLLILKMRIVFLLQHLVTHMDPILNAEFTEQLMEEKRGKKFCIKMKIPEPFRLRSIQKILISFMPICGLHGKGLGRMGNGTAQKAACINQLMEEIHGRN